MDKKDNLVYGNLSKLDKEEDNKSLSKVKISKDERLLDIYTRFLSGEIVDAKEIAEKYVVDVKTIRRTFDSIDNYLGDKLVSKGENLYIENITKARNEFAQYRLVNAEGRFLTRGEIIAVCKILLDSRGLAEEEMDRVINKLIKQAVMPKDHDFIKSILANEWFNYTEASHSLPLLENIVDISKAIQSRRIIKVQYKRSDGNFRERILEPLGIIFNEYYFYLAANIQNIDKEKHFIIKGDTNPTVYRLDRMENVEILDERFVVKEEKRFKDGEYRKRLQFMFGGENHKISLLVKEFSYETVEDHLPDFIIEENNKYKEGEDKDYDYIFSGELFGEGIIFFLLSQGDGVKLIGPESLRDKLRQKAERLVEIYS